MASKIHPELLEQLERAGDEPVQAVVQLRPTAQPDVAPPPHEFAALAAAVLQRVAAEVGHQPDRTNPLANLATLIVQADPDFVRSSVRQPEVISAMPTDTKENLFIPPKGKRPA